MNLLNLKQNKFLKLFLIAILVIAYLVAFFLFKRYNITREELDSLLGPLSSYGILSLFILQTIFSLTPFPDNFLIFGGVIIFGAIETFFAIYLSYLVATSIHFWIARHFGKDWVYKRFPQVKEGMEKYDYLFKPHNLIIIRFLAFNTFDFLAYAAGFSRISYRSYLLSSIISMPLLIIPGILLFQGLFAESWTNLIIIYGLMLIFLFIIRVFMKKAEVNINKKRNEKY